MMNSAPPKTMNGFGASSTIQAPKSGSNPNGTTSAAAGSKTIKFPPASSGIPAERSGNPTPQNLKKTSSNAGGTVDTTPRPKRKGMPGIPSKGNMPNR